MSGGGGCGPTGMAECPQTFANSPYNSFNPPPSTYVVNSKIMVVAVAVLFGVVIFILCLHVYAKWFWRNQGGALGATDGTLRTVSWRRRRRDARGGVPNSNGTTTNPLVVQQSVGLDKAVIAALPMFEFDGKKALECAVCLEEFEEGEKGRTLPKCDHHFHLDCVDMWLHSHSTCPLCRASVRPDSESKGIDTALAIHDQVPVIGDVQAPFMAAMRASRRRQRSRGSSHLPNSLTSPTGDVTSVINGDLTEAPESSLTPASEQPRETNHETPPTSAVDPKVLALEYENPAEIPSNVLFWGNNNNNNNQTQPSASQPQLIRAPFQVTIDIPGPAGSQSLGIVMSPMARASASFRRLLSRGKSVVSPQDDGPDEGGPSASPRHHHHQMAPSPPPPNAS